MKQNSTSNNNDFFSFTSYKNKPSFYEEMGLFPRSFNRVFDRFIKQVFYDVEKLVIQEYRFFRYLCLITLKTLFILFFAPLLVNILAKNYIVRPLTEYFWNKGQTEIFLNSYQQKKAFNEFQHFEETVFFESLTSYPEESFNNSFSNNNSFSRKKNLNEQPEVLQKKIEQRALDLAVNYNSYSIEAITNFFSDLSSIAILFYLFYSLEIQISITKSFLLEFFFSMTDIKKSLLILLITDLLVGYHSPNIWEFFFEYTFNHYGIPQNHTATYLLVATLPVLLDILFKYLIFRHLNRTSPTTVATYHALIE